MLISCQVSVFLFLFLAKVTVFRCHMPNVCSFIFGVYWSRILHLGVRRSWAGLGFSTAQFTYRHIAISYPIGLKVQQGLDLPTDRHWAATKCRKSQPGL